MDGKFKERLIKRIKMKIIPDFNLETIQKAIVADFPDLKIDSINLIENGWDNVVVEINSNLIFRFPKDSEVNFDVEVKVLDFLKDKISIQIPKIEFLGKSFTYMSYRKAHGGNLTEAIFDSLSDAQKEKLTFDLANFLREMHGSISPDEAQKLGVEDEDLPSYSRSIKKVLPKRI